jgi:hypothetical protein
MCIYRLMLLCRWMFLTLRVVKDVHSCAALEANQMLPYGLDHRMGSVVNTELCLSLLEVAADRFCT